MKKLINDPTKVVKEMLEGIGVAYGDLVSVNFSPNFIYRNDAPVKGKVAIISGGGSGHEPLHGGYVGYGMLDAACPGDVFSSPTPDQMYEAAKKVNGGAGILFIVKNYTGDVMNFDMAKELLKGDGIDTESIVVNDDVAVENSTWTAGRRGVGGTVFVEKIVGAAAEVKKNILELKKLGEKVIANVRSIGIALTPCTVPAAGKPTFTLNEDEFEFGVGIHGEPGRKRLPLKPADKIVEMMMDAILKDIELKPKDEVTLLINGMGGTPLIELYIVTRKVFSMLKDKNVAIYKPLIGNYITSLEMQGASITVLKLDEELKKYLDAKVHTIGLRVGM
ncbi:MAG: dihydroxyacetone kinase subunit DhaK [Candidatus Atribacteria bacterium]|jgi:dihydroxyacetone kinase-like protein|nr:dihydroxyacetone kinase subunit DhaK [Candidatus Atribacteria bacterium]